MQGRPNAELIADQLREQIIQGIFRPGEQINESILAIQLNTSRSPVREAVQRLYQEGILNSSPKHIRNTCQALKRILRNMTKQVAINNWQSIAQLDMQFHTTIVAAAGNSRMTRIYETLAAESTMCILNLEISYPRAQTLIQEHEKIQEHENIFNLLEAGSGVELRKALKRHMQKAVLDLTATTPGTKMLGDNGDTTVASG